MDYPFTLPDHPDLNLALRACRILADPKILKDGVPLSRTNGIYAVTLADGSTLDLKIKNTLIPKIKHAGQVIDVVPKPSGFWIVEVYAPIVMIPVGVIMARSWGHVLFLLLLVIAAFIGACSGLALRTAVVILNSRMQPLTRYALALIIPPLTIVACTIVVNLALKLM